MKEYLPYLVTIVCSIISGLVSYFASRAKSKADTDRLVKQYELDIENEREKFKMEKERLEIEHRHQLELIEAQAGNNISNTIITEAMKIPEVRQQVSQGVRNGSRKKHK